MRYALSVSMTTFCYFMAEYAWRRGADRPFRKPEMMSYTEAGTPPAHRVLTHHMKLLIAGICISTVLIYVRCVFPISTASLRAHVCALHSSVYRIIEFADGFNGTIAHTQVLFSESRAFSTGRTAPLRWRRVLQTCSTA